tara:strand:+ start:424 stop:759 length:336 start_codon:yes stop_codon:yes gene_type:complete
MMFAVVRHTYQLNIPDPKNVFSQESSAKWVHLVWVFDTEMDALSFAISLLDDPLITSNEWLLESAIHQLEENRFYQVGRESVAIAEVQESPVIVYEDELNEDIKDEQKSIH